MILPVQLLAQPSNEKVSTTFSFNGEPFLAVSPLNSQNIAVAWMCYSATAKVIAIRTRASSDAGATWSTPVDLPHAQTGWGSADVSMAWRKDGILFLCYIDYHNNSDTFGGVFVVHSSDGGVTWSTPVEAINADENSYISLDRPWVAIDNSTASTSGNLYIPTKPAPWHIPPSHTFFTRSIDSGETWSKETVLDSTPFSALDVKAPMGSPAVSSDGTLYVAYPCYDLSQKVHAGFVLATSTDGGVSFTRNFILQPSPNRDTLSKGGFRLVADPTKADHLALFWLDSRNGDNDIYSSTTFNGGASWSDTMRVNDDEIGNGILQDMLWPTFSADGKLAVVWRDRRNGKDTGYASATDTYYAFSTDGGLTFSKNFRMSDSTAPYETILDSPGNDFMSAALVNDTLFAAWADTRTSTTQIPQLEIYFAKAAIGQSSWVHMSDISKPNTNLSIHPNPSKNNSNATFTLDRPSHCMLSLYDQRGAMVRSLLDDEESAGDHSFSLSNAGVAAGDYLLILETSEGRDIVKVTITP